MKTSRLLLIIIIFYLCTGCAVESVQCLNGKAYHFYPRETDLCKKYSIENDILYCYSEDGSKSSVSPKRPMTIVEYSKFQRKVGADPFSGFTSKECISSTISE